MQDVICHWGAISCNIAIAHSLKSSEDAPMRRPTTYFVTVLIRLTSLSLPKTMNHRQCRLIFVTGGQYHAIKVIGHSLKILEDVPMRRPATHFVRVLNKLMSKNILKALNYIQYKLLIVTQEQYHIDKPARLIIRLSFGFVSDSEMSATTP